MCLSTVYKNKMEPETIVLKNVMHIACKDGMVVLTDLMDRQVVVVGKLLSVDLVGGVAIVQEA